jgi:hypothetical protein
MAGEKHRNNNLGKRDINPGQPPLDERGAELMKLLPSPEALERIGRRVKLLLLEIELRDRLIKILNKELKSPKINLNLRK